MIIQHREELVKAVNGLPSEIETMFKTAEHREVTINNELKTTFFDDAQQVIDQIKENYDDTDATIFEIREEIGGGQIDTVSYFNLVKCECGKFTVRRDVLLLLKHCRRNPTKATFFADGQDMGLCAMPSCDDY